MLRRSVRALEVLWEPAVLLRRGGAGGGKLVGRRAAAALTPATGSVSARAAPLRSSFRPRAPAPPRRALHTSRARRAPHEEAGAKQSSSGPHGAGAGASAEARPLSLSARLKKLSREYGWTAVGVYFGLSLLDFPFCFLLVRTLGTDRIAAAEDYVVSHVKAVIPDSVTAYYRKYRAALKEAQHASGTAAPEEAGAAGEGDADGWGVKEAEERNKHEASLATQLALAYAIHKSFIFVRVPLTAAVTPKVVKVLRAWGWKIGKQKPA